MPKVRSFTVLPALPDSLKDLEIIARNMFWSWNPEFIELFKRIDNTLWEASGHNPIKFLGDVSQGRLEELTENKGFLGELQRAVEKLKIGMDIETELLGILFTMVGTSLKSARDIVDLVHEHYGEDVFKTKIRRNVKLSEAPSFGMNIFDYAPKAHGAEDYLMLADEVVERCGIK